MKPDCIKSSTRFCVGCGCADGVCFGPSLKHKPRITCADCASPKYVDNSAVRCFEHGHPDCMEKAHFAAHLGFGNPTHCTRHAHHGMVDVTIKCDKCDLAAFYQGNFGTYYCYTHSRSHSTNVLKWVTTAAIQEAIQVHFGKKSMLFFSTTPVPESSSAGRLKESPLDLVDEFAELVLDDSAMLLNKATAVKRLLAMLPCHDKADSALPKVHLCLRLADAIITEDEYAIMRYARAIALHLGNLLRFRNEVTPYLTYHKKVSSQVLTLINISSRDALVTKKC